MEERTFNESVRERKSLAASARHRVCGSKSKRCTLPSDLLTPAQRNKLNGEVKVYAINRPMSWEKFTAMPKDLQQAHLDFIQRTFDVGMTYVSEKEFNLARNSLNNYIRRVGLVCSNRKGGKSANALNTFDKWLEDASASRDTTPSSDVCDTAIPVETPDLVEELILPEETPTSAEKPTSAEIAPDMCIIRGSVDLSGDADRLCQYISFLLAGRPAKIHFEYEF